jgi:2-dehydro-3-deoxygluconokinase
MGIKMSRVITIGEPLALFVANEITRLEDVENFTRYIAGAEVNFSIGMSRLGHQVSYISKVGNDPFGRHIKSFLEENGIDTSYVSFDEIYKTGMMWKEKVEEGDPYVYSLRKGSAASHMDKSIVDNISWEDVCHLHITGIPSAISVTCRELIAELMSVAKSKGVQISYDTNLRKGLWSSQEEMIHVTNTLAKFADIILPGVEEAKLLTGKVELQDMADFYHQLGVKTVVMKLGAKGAFTSSEGISFYTEGFKIEKVIDTVGAGDAFAVGVVSGILEGMKLEEAVRRGTATGARAVMFPGDNDGLPNREELAVFIK